MTQETSSLRRVLAVLMLLVCGLGVARAQSTEAEIKARLVGKSLFLKGFWDEDRLRFDAHRLHYKAETTIEVIVGADGKILESHIAKAAGLGVDEGILFWVRRDKWKPGTDHGTPAAVQEFSDITLTPQ